jgi:hypothetical protein
MSGPPKLATTAVKLVFERIANETEERMSTILDRLET